MKIKYYTRIFMHVCIFCRDKPLPQSWILFIQHYKWLRPFAIILRRPQIFSQRMKNPLLPDIIINYESGGFTVNALTVINCVRQLFVHQGMFFLIIYLLWIEPSFVDCVSFWDWLWRFLRHKSKNTLGKDCLFVPY